ncbi:MAG: sulfotransferase [Candidatus Dormibacteraeota bacterium]|nr:sulfotransferase [Candidatus Dormibacteraeota bacterium]
MEHNITRTLIVGVPRSGSSWVGEILGTTSGAVLVHEPDNPVCNPQAWRLRERCGWFPVFHPGEAAPEYRQVWDLAFAGGWPLQRPAIGAGKALKRLPPRLRHAVLRPLAASTRRLRSSPQHVVVKSVYATFALEWLVSRYDPHVVVIQRNPLNVISSWMDLEMPLGDLATSPRVRTEYVERRGLPPPPRDARPLLQIAWGVGLQMAVLEQEARRHPEWVRVRHEDLCLDPAARFPELASRAALTWSSAAQQQLNGSQTTGTGYGTRRIAADLPEKWRGWYSAADRRAVMTVLERFDDLQSLLPKATPALA